MRLFFALIFLFHALLSNAQQPEPVAPAPATPDTTKPAPKRMGILTDTLGAYKVMVGQKRLRIRQMTLYSRVELYSDGSRKELERYLWDDRKRRKFSGDVWNAIPITKTTKK